MKKGFPHTILGISIGWQKLGEVSGVYVKPPGIYEISTCSFCKTTIRIGREKGTIFRYCPLCMLKMKKE